MTLPQTLAAQARRYGGSKVALREKAYGIWQQVTWEAYAAHVNAVCLGLEALGLRRGESLVIVTGNRPAWLYTELGAQTLGAIPVLVDVDSPSDQVGDVVAHSEARVVMVEDQEQADKVLGVRARLPRLERIVVDDTRGLEDYREPMLISLEAVARLGREADARDRGHYATLLAPGSSDDPACVAYSGSTTGALKAATLSHRDLLTKAAGVIERDHVSDTDEIVSFLPLSWGGEQLLSVAIALHAGATVNFPEAPTTVRENLREIGPHVIIAPPGFWAAMCSEHRVKIADAGWLKAVTARLALNIGTRVADHRLHGQSVGPALRVLAGVARLVSFRALLDRLGLSRVRSASTGGAALDPETSRFFRAIGVNLKDTYGEPESSAAFVFHQDHDVKPATVGGPPAAGGAG